MMTTCKSNFQIIRQLSNRRSCRVNLCCSTENVTGSIRAPYTHHIHHFLLQCVTSWKWPTSCQGRCRYRCLGSVTRGNIRATNGTCSGLSQPFLTTAFMKDMVTFRGNNGITRLELSHANTTFSIWHSHMNLS